MLDDHIYFTDWPYLSAIDTANPGAAVVLRCACCGQPWARLEDGALIVESRHSGKVHVNKVTVAALMALVGDAAEVVTVRI